MSSLSQREVTDKLIKEMAILMLSLEERDPAFGNEAAWDFIATELIGENDRKAVLHYLKGETRPLVRLGTESIRIASNGAKELLSLLHNTSRNIKIGAHFGCFKATKSFNFFTKPDPISNFKQVHKITILKVQLESQMAMYSFKV